MSSRLHLILSLNLDYAFHEAALSLDMEVVVVGATITAPHRPGLLLQFSKKLNTLSSAQCE